MTVVEPTLRAVSVAPSVALSASARAGAAGRARRWTLVRPIVPALLVAAGYVDPGNWGADVASGARFGYQLVWVLGLATVCAGFLQVLAARVGIASGQDLATLIATRVPFGGRLVLVPPLLAALAVTEIVEVLGVVVGVQLLTGWSTLPSLLVAGIAVVAVCLAPPGPTRVVVLSCLGLVAVVYVGVLAVSGGGAVAGVVPSALPPGGLPVTVALVGAVVMPHNILLHSTLARDTRHELAVTDPPSLRRAARGGVAATVVALVLALAVNLGITSVAVPVGASASGSSLASVVATFGPAATVLFAVTLIAAGLASTVTGGMVGADTLRQLLPGLRLGDPARRALCLVPAGVVVATGLPEVTVLVWSQVVLTAALPLVLVPLVVFAGRRDLCGALTVSQPVRAAAAVVVATLGGAGIVSLVGF
ncbi:divalent metal cation transporter [Jatrophihabitans sp. YIM 134969]